MNGKDFRDVKRYVGFLFVNDMKKASDIKSASIDPEMKMVKLAWDGGKVYESQNSQRQSPKDV